MSAASIQTFTACVFAPDDIVEVRPLPPRHLTLPPVRQTWSRASELADATATLQKTNADRYDIYVGANPRSHHGGASRNDVSLARCLFADFDGVTVEEVREGIESAGLPAPTLTLNSGHGVHTYWRLTEPMTDLAAWTGFQKDLIGILGSDPAIHDPARIMRLPGFVNHKEPVADCLIVDADPSRTYDLAELHECIPTREQAAEPPTPTTPAPVVSGGVDVIARAERYASRWPAVGEGGRNSAAFYHAAQLTHDFALSDSEAWPIMVKWNTTNDPPLGDAELRTCFGKGRQHGKNDIGGKADRSPPQSVGTAPTTDHVPHDGRDRDRSGTSASRLVTRTISEVEPEEVDWLWLGRFPQGKLSLIVGHPGCGKSFLSLDIAARLSRGTPFPDEHRTDANTPGRVLLLTAEDGLADTVRPRLDACGADCDKIIAIEGTKRPEDRDNDYVTQFDMSADLRHLEEAIRAHPDVRLLIVDTVSSYLGRGCDSHKDADVRKVLLPLAALADRTGIAVIGIAHLNKTNTGMAITRIMGSLGFIGVARAAWLVVRDKDDPEKRLFLQVKNNLAPDPGGLAFKIVDGCVSWCAGAVDVTADDALSDDKRRESPAADEAVEWLQAVLAAGPAAATDLQSDAKSAGITWATIRRVKPRAGVVSFQQPDAEAKMRWYWKLKQETQK